MTTLTGLGSTFATFTGSGAGLGFGTSFGFSTTLATASFFGSGVLTISSLGSGFFISGFGAGFELAKRSYEAAVLADEPVVDAYRNLGYVNLKQGNKAQAANNFRRYLELDPDADDREMIEFILEE